MTMQALEDQIAERRRQAEAKKFRERAHALVRKSYDVLRSSGGFRCTGHEDLEIETVLVAGQNGLSSSTVIRFRRVTVFEEHDFTVTRYIPGEEWERVFDFLVDHYAKEALYEPSDPRDRLPLIDEEKIEVALRRVWGL